MRNINFLKQELVSSLGAEVIAILVFGLTLALFLNLEMKVFAATGSPQIISYQGRLTDASGNLLGGSGTAYYFKFSIWDSATVASGTRLWPTSAPGSSTSTVKSGVFNVNIGDTANGYPDALTYNFYSTSTVYLQVEVSSDGVTYETLSPRQQIASAGFSLNANTVAGLVPGWSQNTGFISLASSTDQVGVGATSSLAKLFVQSNAASTVTEVLQGAAGQTADLFRAASSSGVIYFQISNLGVASSTEFRTSSSTIATLTFTNASGTNLTNSGYSALQGLSFTNASGTNLTVSGYLQGANGYITSVSSTNIGATGYGTFPTLNFTNASGTNISVTGYGTFPTLNFTSASGTNVTASGYLQGTTLNVSGASALQGLSFANASGTNASVSGYGLFPSLAFTNATGTGNLNIGTITLGTSTAASSTALLTIATSTNILTVLNNGNVGIGTTNPGYGLVINGTNSLSFNTEQGASGEIPAGMLVFAGSNDNLTFVPAANGAAGNKIVTAYYNGSAWYSASEVANVASGYSNLLLMKSGGNVGIGTTGPVSKLDVNASGGTYVLNTAAGTVLANSVLANGTADIVSALAVDTRAEAADVGGVIGFGGKYLSTSNTVVTYATIKGAKENGTNGSDSGYLAFQTRPTGNYTQERMRITSTGLVGIGTSTPAYRLDVVDSAATTAAFTNTTTTDNASTTALRLNLFTNASGTLSRFIQFYASSTNSTNGVGVGHIGLTTGGAVQYATGAADFGEYFKMENGAALLPGDIAAINENGNATLASSAENAVAGVVSVTAGFVGNLISGPSAAPHVIVGLLGQIPTRVSFEGGAIRPGDPVSLSSIPGVGRKAAPGDRVFGAAMQALDAQHTDGLPCEIRDGAKVCLIDVLVNAGWGTLAQNPGLVLGNAGAASSITDSGFGSFGTVANFAASVRAGLGALTGTIQTAGDWFFNTISAAFVKTEVIQVETGITMKDQATGAYYCVAIVNGALTTSIGKCGSAPLSAGPSTPLGAGDMSSSTSTSTTQAISSTSTATSTSASSTSSAPSTNSTNSPSASTSSASSATTSTSTSIISSTSTSASSSTP